MHNKRCLKGSTKSVGEYGVDEVYSRVSYHAYWIDNVINDTPNFRKNYTSQYHFAQDSIKDNLAEVCNKIGF